MTWVIGVDIGGTFTDCVGIDSEGRLHCAKSLSTHETDVAEGVLAALAELARQSEQSVSELLGLTARFGHGTTIGTNLLVERRGARTTLITTAGHRDALAMMRGAGRTAGIPIDQVFNVRATSKPAPLIPRAAIAEVQERVAAHGVVAAPLDETGARDAIRALLDRNSHIQSVAITLLWSFQNDVHERRLAELVHDVLPDAFISLSSQVAPRQGEYERTVAAVINSYIGPSSVAYLDSLIARLSDAGFTGQLLVMQSNGGVAEVERARATPIRLLGSGPAGGISGAALVAARTGHRNVITADMGGTSFDIGLLIDGRPVVVDQHIIDQYTFHQPHLDVRSIACGGGSIASIAPDGGLRVGPGSAGSLPGPACYGRGGTDATVTDADVVLGLLSPEAFMGGDMHLDSEAARRAVAGIAESLKLSVEEAAAGILRVNNHAAATLMRQRTLEQGLDPRDFVVYAYGGAGPLHAWGFAAELGTQQVVIPLGNGAATLSAFGIAAGDLIQHHEVECRVQSPLDPQELREAVDLAETRARAASPGTQPVLERTALIRYAEQLLQSVPVRIPSGPIDEAACRQLIADFDAEYERQYGAFAMALFHAVEVFAVRVEARISGNVTDVSADPPLTPAQPRTERDVYWPAHGQKRTPVYDGAKLGREQTIVGPAVIELAYTTVPVPPGQRLTRDSQSDALLLNIEAR